MEKLLQSIAADPNGNDIIPLIRLVNRMRPADSTDGQQAEVNILALTYLLEHDSVLRTGLRNYVSSIFSVRKQVHIYTDIGILANVGFSAATFERLVWRFLPPVVNQDYMKDVFGLVFHLRDDYLWIEAVENDTWLRLLDALYRDEEIDPLASHHSLHQILSAIQVLSYRITAIGLEPELVRNHPAIEQFQSPFLRQNEEIIEYVSQYRHWLTGERTTHMDDKQAQVLLEQCREVLESISRNSSKNGISVSLTYLLQRATQSISRLETLFLLMQSNPGERLLVGVVLFKELVRADNKKYSIRELYSKNTELLALQVTENAGKTGEHYVTSDAKGYFSMLRSAMGAGFLVAFMALFKLVASKLKLALIGEAFVNSMNYSLGFMLIHVLHLTVATKQPAMTASMLAATLKQKGTSTREKKADLNHLADLTVNVFRTQFVAICGNMVVAFPISLLVAVALQLNLGQHVVTPEKAQHLLHDLNIFETGAIFYAAIAGVFLFLSGLISGYYDNKSIYNHIPERLRQLRWLQSLLGTSRLFRVTSYIENNLGALAGNFFFGILLGSTPILGQILGLPLDVRHITLSTAALAYALVGLDFQTSWQAIVIAFVGIGGIGMTNLLVSFSLALMVALKAQGVQYRRWMPLVRLLGLRFLKRPGKFFFPGKDAPLKNDDAVDRIPS